MNKFITTLSAAAFALASLSATADTISVGGVTWDSVDNDGGLTASFNFQQWFSTSLPGFGSEGQFTLADDLAVPVGAGALAGLGEFYNFSNGRGPTAVFDPNFCTSCELTFAFGGLLPTPPNGGEIAFDTTNSWLNIYFDETPDFANFTNLPDTAHSEFVEAQNGTLWASFVFDSFVLDGSILGGFVEAELSVVGGLADVVEALNFHDDIADIAFTSSAIFGNDELYSDEGNGQISNNIPEPTTLAILGLGLLGLAGARRKQS